MKKKFFPLILILLPLLTLAQAGSLDAAFGSSGKSLICYDTNVISYSSVLLTDGKIVVAGLKYPDISFVSRINSNGTLDTTFGTNGITNLVTNTTTEVNLYTFAITIQSDGKTVVVGYVTSSVGLRNFIIIRLNTDGTLDSSFANNGKLNLDLGTEHDHAYAVKIQNDSKIIVGGSSGSVNGGFTLVRLNANGTLDTSFGIGGKVVTVFASGNESQINSIALQTDGKIVAGGFRIDGTKNFAVARYNNDGSLDTSFGTNGKVITIISPGISDELRRIKIQNDGKILTLGNTNLYGSIDQSGITMIRYLSNGTLDNSFGSNGIKKTLGYGASSFALQTDDKIVVGSADNDGTNVNFLTLRYTSNGTLDSTFDGDGMVNTNFNSANYSYTTNVLIQSDNKIVVVGGSANSDSTLSCVATVRLNPGTLGTEEFAATTIKAYPNPTKDKVFFNHGSNAFTGIGVYNYLGQEVLRKSLSAEATQEVDLSGFSSGVYLLKLEGENGGGLVKVVKE